MILFMGIAGSGKGTQADLLSKYLNSPKLSSGEILRRHKDEDNIQKALSEGALVKDSVLLPIIESEIINSNEDHLILDGFPRNMVQARWLVQKAQQGEFILEAVIHLKLSPEVAQARLLERQRDDDNKTAINKRFSDYENYILPIVNFFKAQNLNVYAIDGDKDPESVSTEIKQALGV